MLLNFQEKFVSILKPCHPKTKVQEILPNFFHEVEYSNTKIRQKELQERRKLQTNIYHNEKSSTQ